jgi:hypothetical protein
MKHYFISNLPCSQTDGEYRFYDSRKEISRTISYGYIHKETEIKHEILGDLFQDYHEIQGNNRDQLHEFFKEIYHEMRDETPDANGKNDVLFFIHGYDVDLERSNIFFKTLVEKYVEAPDTNIKKVIMMLWPSDVRVNLSPWGYRRESSDAKFTGSLLREFFKEMLQFLQSYARQYEEQNGAGNTWGGLHIMAQSMGNQVLGSMLEDFFDGGFKSGIFRQAILVGADIENDCLEKGKALHPLTEISNRVTVYYRKEDIALWGSDVMRAMKKFNSQRPLGLFGPKTPGNLPENVKAINITGSRDRSITGGRLDRIDDWFLSHRYFIFNDKIVEDIIETLKGKASSRKIGERKELALNYFELSIS